MTVGSFGGQGGVDVVDTFCCARVTLVPHGTTVVVDGAVGTNGDAVSSGSGGHTRITLVLIGRSRDNTSTTAAVNERSLGSVVAVLCRAGAVAGANTVLTIGVLAEAAIGDTTRDIDFEAAVGGDSSLAGSNSNSRGCASESKDCGKHLSEGRCEGTSSERRRL